MQPELENRNLKIQLPTWTQHPKPQFHYFDCLKLLGFGRSVWKSREGNQAFHGHNDYLPDGEDAMGWHRTFRH